MVKENRINFWYILRLLIMLGIVLTIVYPLLYMISVSFSENIYVMQNKVTFYPKGFNLGIYKFVLNDKRIFNAYGNTILYTVVGTTIALVITTLAAYALSKRNRCPFAKAINIMVLVTMFFSGGMIPGYLAIKWLGLYDTMWAVILPPSLSAWNLIIMRTFFSVFPEEIEESGRIDGLNDFGLLWYLVLPTSTAVLATIGLFYGVGLWNAFFGPFLYLKTESKYPLQIILRDIIMRGQSTDNEVLMSGGSNIIPEDSIKYATILVSIIPIIAVYPYLQKYFVKGVMIGSVKG